MNKVYDLFLYDRKIMKKVECVLIYVGALVILISQVSADCFDVASDPHSCYMGTLLSATQAAATMNGGAVVTLSTKSFCYHSVGSREAYCTDEIPDLTKFSCCGYSGISYYTDNYNGIPAFCAIANSVQGLYADADGNCICSSDDACNRVTNLPPYYEYCVPTAFQGATINNCGSKHCSNSYDCPSGSICTSKGDCSHLIDADGDRLPGTIKADNTQLSPGQGIDCDDTSKLCTTDCTNSDPGTKGQQDNIPDCKDFCVDHDGDGACNMAASRRVIDSTKYASLPANVQAYLDLKGFDHSTYATKEDINDTEYTKYDFLMMAGVYVTNGNDYYNDCDDNDPLITPLKKEDNSCNFIDDDCNGVVDDCSSGKNIDRNIVTKTCVYKGNIGCQVWDFDNDSFMNASFGCPDCTDCNDFDASIHPGAMDDGSTGVDMNCNVEIGEMLKTDDDDILDMWDVCKHEGLVNPYDFNGCWFSTKNNNLPGVWSTG